MVGSDISTHVMVKPCFRGIEQDFKNLNILRKNYTWLAFLLQFFRPDSLDVSTHFQDLKYFCLQNVCLTSVFSPSVPDYRWWGQKLWRWSEEDHHVLDLTWSLPCLAQLNHHMSEFVTKFLDQQIKYKVRFTIISVCSCAESFHPYCW